MESEIAKYMYPYYNFEFQCNPWCWQFPVSRNLMIRSKEVAMPTGTFTVIYGFIRNTVRVFVFLL